MPQKKKGSKVLLRVLACVSVAALGFGGGLGGAVVASRAGLTGNQGLPMKFVCGGAPVTVGAISESDVNLAQASGAVIVVSTFVY